MRENLIKKYSDFLKLFKEEDWDGKSLSGLFSQESQRIDITYTPNTYPCIIIETQLAGESGSELFIIYETDFN